MNKFVELIKKNLHLIVFAFLCIISIFLIANNNTYLKSSAFNSSNSVSGSFYNARNSISKYFGLAKRNYELQQENRKLREFSILNYSKHTNKVYQIEDSFYTLNYSFINAEVVKNSINKKSNYLTLNRGKKDGVEKGMGVISPSGLVGKVKSVSNNFCLVVSCLNTEEFGVPTSIVGLNLNEGVLKWDGTDIGYVSLDGISKFEKIEENMKVVTGPFTRRFPSKTEIGTIHSFEKLKGEAFYDIKIKLNSDFKMLNEVYIIKDLYKQEIDSLENIQLVE